MQLQSVQFIVYFLAKNMSIILNNDFYTYTEVKQAEIITIAPNTINIIAHITIATIVCLSYIYIYTVFIYSHS